MGYTMISSREESGWEGKELVWMFFLAPILPAAAAAAETALACEAAQMFVGGAVTAASIFSQRKGE